MSKRWFLIFPLHTFSVPRDLYYLHPYSCICSLWLLSQITTCLVSYSTNSFFFNFRILEIRSLKALTLDWNQSVERTSKEVLRENPFFVFPASGVYSHSLAWGCISQVSASAIRFFFLFWLRVKSVLLPHEKNSWLHLAFRVQLDNTGQSCHLKIPKLITSAKTFFPSFLPYKVTLMVSRD